ncbi:MAG TPA: septum formation initiator [Bacteroidales bacterium]|nr:septum formation initiator [Bacteroidales bacterium]HBZ22556.1 septum formation initiator [Bacteroidales bacterium]
MILSKFIEKIPPFFRNRYLLTIIVFVIWVVLLDSNNLLSQYKEMKNLKNLRVEKEYYVKRIEEDKRKLHELKTDDQNLEKFAREQYRMKKPDEDLFIILTPQENRRIKRENNN